MKCANCNKETSNPRFCCRSCAAKVTNREVQKRPSVAKSFCESCGEACKSRNRFCTTCRVPDYTKGELLNKNVKYSSRHALIRHRAQHAVRSREKVYISCGYSKHVEVCHVKAVKDFEDSAKLSEINSDDNLVLLCPNCHWEFDNLKEST